MDALIVYQSPFPKQRLGPANDGGYVICQLPGTYDHMLTGGVGGNLGFEEAMLGAHPDLHIEAFDATVQRAPLVHPRLTFHRQNLGNASTPKTTNLVSQVNAYRDVFMKIDIEGHEFRVLPDIIKLGAMKRIKQLIVEFHTPFLLTHQPRRFAGLQDITFTFMHGLLADISNTHVLVHLHANNYSGAHMQEMVPCPNVLECTYVRQDFVGVLRESLDPIPSHLDRPCKPNAPDIALRGFPYNTLDEQDYRDELKREIAEAASRGDRNIQSLAIEYRVHRYRIRQWMRRYAAVST